MVFVRFFLGLVFSLKSLEARFDPPSGNSSSGGGSTPGTQFSSGSSISGAIGKYKSESFSSSSSSELQNAGIGAVVSTSTYNANIFLPV